MSEREKELRDGYNAWKNYSECSGSQMKIWDSCKKTEADERQTQYDRNRRLYDSNKLWQYGE